MSKMIRDSELVASRWFDVRVGSSIVSYCDDCGIQRTMTCVDRQRMGDDFMLVFLCDHCRFSMNSNEVD